MSESPNNQPKSPDKAPAWFLVALWIASIYILYQTPIPSAISKIVEQAQILKKPD